MRKGEKHTLAQIDDIIDRARLTDEDFERIRLDNMGSRLYIDNGTIKRVIDAKAIKQTVAIIDWLHFTVHELTFEKRHKNILSDNDLIIAASKDMQDIFGFGVTVVKPNGAFFYDRSYEIGDRYGLLCHGGQRNTVFISITSLALNHAKDGWEQRLYDFLYQADRATITRIDLAHDSFEPTFFTVDSMLEEYMAGNFNNSRTYPSISQAGNWIHPDGGGRTLYIGKRQSGMYCRCYEKGLQLDSTEFPRWVRCEVEIKSADRIIPLNVLLIPHFYLAGTYPVFNRLNEDRVRIDTLEREIRADIDHRKKWAKHQAGSVIQLLIQLGLSDEEIVKELKANKLPPKFKHKFLENQRENITQINGSSGVFDEFNEPISRGKS